MASPHYFTSVGKSVALDLAQAFAGYTKRPELSASAVDNGTVTVSGKTATFVPARAVERPGQVTVTDGDGSTMTKYMVAFVDDGTGTCP